MQSLIYLRLYLRYISKVSSPTLRITKERVLETPWEGYNLEQTLHAAVQLMRRILRHMWNNLYADARSNEVYKKWCAPMPPTLSKFEVYTYHGLYKTPYKRQLVMSVKFYLLLLKSD